MLVLDRLVQLGHAYLDGPNECISSGTYDLVSFDVFEGGTVLEWFLHSDKQYRFGIFYHDSPEVRLLS